jgi:2-polyprenyl-3-methyl-5-hydroxy-6-metoxy-1,4-benzoquinol methylase
MALRIDPAKVEIRMLKQAVDWEDKHVLEVGCGEGRLTQRILGLGVRRVMAIDTNAERISKAKQNLPAPLKRMVTFRALQAEDIKYPSSTYDIVLFSWVL